MGTTAEKLAYLAETKTAIKNAIIGKGVAVPDGSTFRQLAQLINNIITGLSDEDLAKADATASTVFSGKKFYAKNGTLKTGTALSQATTVTAATMFKGVTAYTQDGVLITGAPTETSAEADDIVTGKTAYDNSGKMLYGTSIGKVISGTMNSRNYVSCGGTIVAAAVYVSTHTAAVVYPGDTICALGNRSNIYGSIQLVGTTRIYWSPPSNGASHTGTYWIIYK